MPTLIKFMIPPGHRELMAELASMPEESAQALRAAFEKAVPTDSPIKLATAVEPLLAGLMKQDAVSVTGMLIAVRSAADTNRLPTTEVVESVALDAQSRKLVEPGQGEQLSRRLDELLRLRSVVLTAKAFELTTEYRDKLQSVRIITDLRPIFEQDDAEPTATSVIIMHTLKLETLNSDDVYVAMTNEELLQLKQQVERALKKTQALDNIIDRGGLQRLDRSEPSKK